MLYSISYAKTAVKTVGKTDVGAPQENTSKVLMAELASVQQAQIDPRIQCAAESRLVEGKTGSC